MEAPVSLRAERRALAYADAKALSMAGIDAATVLRGDVRTEDDAPALAFLLHLGFFGFHSFYTSFPFASGRHCPSAHSIPDERSSKRG